MSENARGKGRKRSLGPIGARQIPSIVQPSGVNFEDLDDLENLAPEEAAPQMGQEERTDEEQAEQQKAAGSRPRRQQA